MPRLHHRPPNRGFTLVELLTVLTIISISIAIAAGPIGRLINDGQSRAVKRDLFSLINYARTSAIEAGIPITLCPLDNSGSCSDNWSLPLTVFRDIRRQRKLANAADVMRVMDSPEGKLKAKTGNRKYLGFRPDGLGREAAGNLVWCPDSGDRTLAFQIRINMGGRPAFSHDTDGDGIVEHPSKGAITCS